MCQNSGATCGQRNRPVASGAKARKLHAHPLGNVSAAFEAVLVGEIEMYAAIDPAAAGFLGGLGEAREVARHAGYGRIGRGCAGCESVVLAEFGREDSGGCAAKGGVAGCVLGERRCNDQRAPARVGDGERITVEVAEVDRRHGAPEIVSVFRLPGGDGSIGQSDVVMLPLSAPMFAGRFAA
jgi:hypothetical protein